MRKKRELTYEERLQKQIDKDKAWATVWHCTKIIVSEAVIYYFVAIGMCLPILLGFKLYKCDLESHIPEFAAITSTATFILYQIAYYIKKCKYDYIILKRKERKSKAKTN